ncbi:DNA damage-binding protein 2 isoform X4 [Pelmatolapia mariae]|uniref:DNA damage-binding protein 2 isoform X4 n=1 Tax=Pelmatolapia mariae TaxID=158779 RepID=UPI002FE6A0A3
MQTEKFLLLNCRVKALNITEMKSKPTKSAAAGSKNKVKKTPEGVSGPTLSRKLRDKKNGETSKSGTALKSAGVQKRGWDGSILHYIYKSTLGQSLHSQMRQCLQEPFVRSLSSYHFHGGSSPFNRRITCLEWHPTHPTTLAVGSKGGDIYLWDFEAPAKKTFIQGIFSDKLHKAKVTHAEFNSRCDWLLVTASVDHTVKLWDLRNIKDKKSFLYEMPHEKAVNSAYFNPLDCSKLLTTDQHDEIRVYSSSDWSKPQHIIQHPHRQFQHLTPIKATWHPMYDLIVAGRYPDDRFCGADLRTIDIFDSNTAELVCQLYDPTASGIKSINKFNPMGDAIGSGMGITVLVWDQNESLMGDHHVQQEGPLNSVLRGQRRSQPRSSGNRRGPAVDAKLKKKLASLEETETKTKKGCTKQKQTQMRKK